MYPNGFPDFKGDVIYSKKHWDEFKNWLRDTKGITLKIIDNGISDIDKVEEECSSKLNEAPIYGLVPYHKMIFLYHVQVQVHI